MSSPAVWFTFVSFFSVWKMAEVGNLGCSTYIFGSRRIVAVTFGNEKPKNSLFGVINVNWSTLSHPFQRTNMNKHELNAFTFWMWSEKLNAFICFSKLHADFGFLDREFMNAFTFDRLCVHFPSRVNAIWNSNPFIFDRLWYYFPSCVNMIRNLNAFTLSTYTMNVVT